MLAPFDTLALYAGYVVLGFGIVALTTWIVYQVLRIVRVVLLDIPVIIVDWYLWPECCFLPLVNHVLDQAVIKWHYGNWWDSVTSLWRAVSGQRLRTRNAYRIAYRELDIKKSFD